MSDTASRLTAASKLTGPALAAAIIALVLWAIFVALMAFQAGTENELLWTRLAFLFASVEAVAFAAGGAMWGNSIQRERAEKAEARASENEESASNGKALAGAILAESESGVGGEVDEGIRRLGGDEDQLLDRHARMARRLFPGL
jgi:hypothetical protein